MGLFEQFPYLNFHEANYDWLVKNVKELNGKVQQLEDSIERELLYHVTLQAGDELDINFNRLSTVYEILLAGNSDNNCGEIILHSRNNGAVYYTQLAASDVTVATTTDHMTITPGTKPTLVYVYRIFGADADFTVTENPSKTIPDEEEK